MSGRRIRAIVRKELREFRHNSSIVVAMSIIPLLFVAPPLIQIFALPPEAASALAGGNALLYMLGIPAIVPALVAAYSIVGERTQDTLEPVLTTPIRQEELLVGKAVAALLPSLIIAYAVYAFVLVAVGLFARPGIASALLQGPALVAQVVFTPLLAAWSIWVAIAISTRSSDVRVAQQLGMLACLPSVVVTTLIAYEVIPPTPGLAVGLFVLLVVLDLSGWRFVSAMFDRERLITATR
ncbi:MAG TPA: ABC transporter permease subunit [Candidatus Limnocylindrales bacterium]|nr:ABC transporter permease subunit [Candidatus Limnocylindrales bacterium]